MAPLHIMQKGEPMRNFLNVVYDALPLMLNGLAWTAGISLISIIFATILGFAFGLMRGSRLLLVRGIATIYVNVFRNTPLLVQILFIYFGLPQLIGLSWSPQFAGIVTLSLNIGAYICEAVRGGVESIDPGQREAGRAIGLSRTKTMRLIVLPQAFRRIVPSFINQCTLCVKDSSLLSIIGVTELTMRGESIYSANFQSFTILLVMGVMYFIINYILSVSSRLFERRVAVA